MNSAQPQAFLALQNSTGAIDDDGWALIAPFGNHPKTRVYRDNGQVKEQKFIQVLDNESADALVSNEDSFFKKLKRALVGIPIYKGHGDLNDHDPKAVANDTEKIKLGVVDKIRKAARGIEAHFNLDNDGAEAVAAGWKLPSALWLVMPIDNAGDVIRARPFKLLSVALTQFPNIPGVESLANASNAADIVPGQPTFTERLIDMLQGMGVPLDDDAAEDEVWQAILKLFAAPGQSSVAAGTTPGQPTPTSTPITNSNPPNKIETMKSKLLGADPSSVTASRAGAVFLAEVRRLVDEQGMDLGTAWAQVKATEPELAARAFEPAQGQAVDNSAPAVAPAPLAQKPFTALAFQLPPNVDDDIFAACWRANGNQAIRVNFQKIFMGLVAFIAHDKGVPVAVARRQVQDDYPNLARYAGESLGQA